MYLNPYPLLEQALLSDNPDGKGKLMQALSAQLGEAEGLTAEASKPVDCRFAGHPLRPRLVMPSEVTPRKMSTAEGYMAMLHAVAHTEFNVINLTLDAAYRLHNMPFQFIRDWVRVVEEEVFHFGLMRGRLNSLGYDYGDFEAHGHLWDMTYKIAYDPLLRMALVPWVSEARGLDATPGIHVKVAQRGDMETYDVLNTTYRDKVGHVAISNHWYQYLCRERGLEPATLSRSLIMRYDMFIFRGYVNIEARERAGFSCFELDMLEDFEKSLKQDKKAA